MYVISSRYCRRLIKIYKICTSFFFNHNTHAKPVARSNKLVKANEREQAPTTYNDIRYCQQVNVLRISLSLNFPRTLSVFNASCDLFLKVGYTRSAIQVWHIQKRWSRLLIAVNFEKIDSQVAQLALSLIKCADLPTNRQFYEYQSG